MSALVPRDQKLFRTVDISSKMQDTGLRSENQILSRPLLLFFSPSSMHRRWIAGHSQITFMLLRFSMKGLLAAATLDSKVPSIVRTTCRPLLILGVVIVLPWH